ITLAARKGESPDMNPDLRSAIEKAKEVNMPADNIERAIKKGAGKLEGVQMENVRYEAYGPGGVAIIIEAITDNNNRTVAEIKHLLSKHNAKFAATGSVTWAFEKKDGKWEAKHKVEISEQDAEKLDKLLEEIDDHDDVQDLFTNSS
ncbi:MAG TPA: YebC/PmpR family DNA-binding transcriptional regulator, partial [bacterium]|nr:YebC/PmpR family DNA-binding transcriptional regulator [bacterium]